MTLRGEALRNADDRYWIVAPRKSEAPPALTLLCFPHAGAGGTIFLPWAEHLPDSVEVVGVHLPGRGTRMNEAPLRSVEEIAGRVAAAIARFERRQFSFFGHSFGAAVAHALALLLRRERRPAPRGIIVSACPAPHLEPKRSFMLHALPRDAFFAELRKLDGIPAEARANEKLQELIEPPLRADIRCRELWFAAMRAQGVPADPLDVPLYPIGGTRDAYVSADDLAQWRHHTTAISPVALFEGGHFYFQERPRPVLAEIARIAAELEPACRR
jgi:medium-chain acyl-[acyl-carrier-protein] hydrolase